MSVFGTGNDRNRQWSQIVLGVFCCIGLLVRIHNQGYILKENWVEYLLFLLFLVVSVSTISDIRKEKKGIK